MSEQLPERPASPFARIAKIAVLLVIAIIAALVVWMWVSSTNDANLPFEYEGFD
jgi:multidrug resistance efflux pump